jgi:hypothetical protein
MSITNSGSVSVALGIQHEMRMRHIVICGLPALQYFSTLSHRRHDFGGEIDIEYKMCVDLKVQCKVVKNTISFLIC